MLAVAYQNHVAEIETDVTSHSNQVDLAHMKLDDQRLRRLSTAFFCHTLVTYWVICWACSKYEIPHGHQKIDYESQMFNTCGLLRKANRRNNF